MNKLIQLFLLTFMCSNICIQASPERIKALILTPSTPILIASQDTICNGESVIISVGFNDSLFDATAWQLYEVSCGGIWLDSNTTGTFTVSPTTTETYYIRGEGTTQGNCGTITIVVNSLPIPSTISTNNPVDFCTEDNVQCSIPISINETFCWRDTTPKDWHYVNNSSFFSGSGTQHSISIEIQPVSNIPFIAFSDKNNSGKIAVMKYVDNNWETVGAQGISSATGEYVQLTFNPTTFEPYIAYSDYGFSKKAVVKKFNGTYWETIGSEGFTSSVARFLSLAIDSVSNDVYLGYTDLSVSSKASVMKFDGTNWNYVGVQGFSTGTTTYLSLVINPLTSEPYLAFSDYIFISSASVMKFDGAAWIQVGVYNFSNGDATCMDLKFQPQTHIPYIAFRERVSSGTNKTSVMKFDGTAWNYVGQPNFSESDASKQKLYFSPVTNEPYVGFSVSYSGIDVMKFNNNNWETVGSRSFNGYYSKSLDMAMHPDLEIPYVIFDDNYSGNDTIKVMKLGQNCLQDSNLFDITNSGIFEVEVTNMEGCSSVSTNVIQVAETPTATAITTDSVICFGEYVTLYGEGTATSYLWDNGIIDDVAFSPDSNGTYILTATDSTGCIRKDTTSVFVNPTITPQIITSNSATLCSSDSVQLSISLPMNNSSCWHNTSVGAWTKEWDNLTVNGSVYYSSMKLHPDSHIPYMAVCGAYNQISVKKLLGQEWHYVGAPTFAQSKYSFLDFNISVATKEPYVIFPDNNNGYKISVMKYDGTNWVYVGLPGFSDGGADQCSIQFDPISGTPYITYRDIFNGKNIVIKKFDGTNWVQVGLSQSTNTKCHVLGFDPTTNFPQLYYSDNGWQYINVRQFNGSWTYLQLIPMSGRTLYIDLAYHPVTKEPYVAFQNNTAGNLSVKKYDGSSWTLVGNDNFYSSEGEYLSLAFDPKQNIPTIAFRDDGNWSMVMHLKDNNWEILGKPYSILTRPGLGKDHCLEFHPITYEPYLSSSFNSFSYGYLYKFSYECLDTTSTVNIDSSGTYFVHEVNQYGCGFNSSNYITINPTSEVLAITSSSVICQYDPVLLTGSGSNSYTWNNGVTNNTPFFPDSTLTYTVVGIDSNNCTSSDSIKIEVIPLTVTDTSIVLCNGSSYLLPGGSTTFISGIYYDTLNTVNCDSIVVSNVLFVNEFFTQINDTICEGTNYTLPSGALVSNSGIHNDTLIANGGCDSIISIELFLRPQDLTQIDSLIICYGDSIQIFNLFRNTSGVYYDTIQSIDGCDSIISQELIVNTTYSAQESPITICSDENITIFGISQNTSGIYYNTLQSINGCDSIISQELIVTPVFSTQETAISICSGENAIIFGNPENTSGIYYDSLQASNGCDSIISQELIVNPVLLTQEAAISICTDENAIIFGVSQNIAGVYYDTLQTVSGCDSIISQELSIMNVDTSVVLSSNTITSQAINANYQWIDCNAQSYILGEVSQSYTTPPNGGLFSVEITQNNCTDTSSCYLINTTTINENYSNSSFIVYPNPTSNLVNLNLGHKFERVEIKVLTVEGKILLSNIYHKKQLFEISLMEFDNGIYLIEIVTETSLTIVKIFKEK